MKHADLFVKLLAEHGGMTVKEARFIFEDFRAANPGPEYLDRELSEREVDITLDLYRQSRPVMQLISAMLKDYGRRPLPRA